MAEITITGLASNDPVPGVYLEVNFAQGEAPNGSSEYSALIIANKTTAGSASAATVYGPTTAVPLASEADAITLFGIGSEAHRMYKRFTKLNQSTPVSVICPAEASGEKATGTFTVSGTATKAGTLRVNLLDEVLEVGFASGDGYATIASALADAINGIFDLPFTASAAASGVVTMTARNYGTRGNQFRYMGRIVEASTGITVTPNSSTAFSGGSGTDSVTTALAAIVSQRFYYVIAAHSDSTNLDAINDQLDSVATPLTGIRQRWIGGLVDTIGNSTTISTGINGFRGELIWLYQSDVPGCELAAEWGSARSLMETKFGGSADALNFCNFGNTPNTAALWNVRAPLSGARATRAQIKSALNNGLSAVGCLDNGRTYVARAVTTYCLNGSTPDYRTRDVHLVTVCDRYADDAKSKLQLQFSGKLLSEDPAEGVVLGPDVVTPKVLKAALNRLTQDYFNNSLLQNVDTIKANTVVSISATPGRIMARVPLEVIDILAQVGVKVDQV